MIRNDSTHDAEKESLLLETKQIITGTEIKSFTKKYRL